MFFGSLTAARPGNIASFMNTLRYAYMDIVAPVHFELLTNCLVTRPAAKSSTPRDVTSRAGRTDDYANPDSGITLGFERGNRGKSMTQSRSVP
jgi:hypothetical protein